MISPLIYVSSSCSQPEVKCCWSFICASFSATVWELQAGTTSPSILPGAESCVSPWGGEEFEASMSIQERDAESKSCAGIAGIVLG